MEQNVEEAKKTSNRKIPDKNIGFICCSMFYDICRR